MSEISMGLAFLYSRLSGDSALATLAPGGVWRSVARQSIDTPFVVISYQSGKDVVTMNGVRVLDDILFLAKCVGPASDTQSIIDAEARLDVVLGGKEGLRNITVSGGYVLCCYRSSPLQYDEPITNSTDSQSHLGGLYRIEIQQS